MPAEAILFLGDVLHESQTVPTLLASTTENGYHPDNVRITDWGRAWKGIDSTTADVWLRVDGGSTTWLGAAGAAAYAAMSWDARGSEQNRVLLVYGALDDGTFTGGDTMTAVGLWQVDSFETEPTSQHFGFTIPTPAKRYYRLHMWGTERSEASGSRVPKIFAWPMYPASGVIRVQTDFVGNVHGKGSLDQFCGIAAARTEAGDHFGNRVAAVQQEFELRLRPGSKALWESLRDKLYDLDGRKRAFFMQFDGLRNSAQADFQMVRLASMRWPAYRRDADQYEITIKIVTEPSF